MNLVMRIFFLSIVLLGTFVVPKLMPHLYAETIYIIPPASEAALKYKSILSGSASAAYTVAKPTCDSSMTAKIFVTPVQMLGGTSTTLVPITGISAYAQDNGTYWSVVGEIKTSTDDTLTNSSAIAMAVEIYCCANADCD